MRLPRILAGYIVREVAQYTALGFLVFGTLMLTQNLLRTLGDLAEATAAVQPADLLTVLALLAPVLTTYALPVAFLFGVLLAVGRMASDTEIKAMGACGLGPWALVGPVLAMALCVSLATGYLMQQVEPAMRGSLRALVARAASRSLGLEPGRFRGLDRRILYVRERDENDLRGVVIWDHSSQTSPFTVFAEEGLFNYDPEAGSVQLVLRRGDVHFEPSPDDPGKYRRIGFETFDYSFTVGEFLATEASRLKPRDMSMAELHANLERVRSASDPREIVDLREQQPAPYEIQIQRRFALPVTPIVFALVGVPLGLRRVRGARAAGAMLCIVLVFAYYALLSLAEFLGEKTAVPASLALWLPNAVFLSLGVFLLLRARRGEI